VASATYLGVDLAWGTRNPTGLAAVQGDRLRAAGSVRTDEEILAWLRPWTDGPCVVAIDGPLIVTNPTGRRPCEAQLNAVFGRYDAGAHPCNTSRPELVHGSRELRLVAQLGLDPAPYSRADRRAVEVYPHPATIVLFGLDRTIKYKHKPGRDLAFLRSELLRLIGHLESLDESDPPLHLAESVDWQRVREAVRSASRKSELKRVEDTVDAVLCGYLAAFTAHRPHETTVFGDAVTGYIVTPTP
jgi:predicted RNase H-like nuclease